MSSDALTLSALVGRGDSPETLVGFEPITRAVRLVLLGQINDEIDRQQALWQNADSALQELGLDPGVGQVEVEYIKPENLFEGSHKSLLDSPLERYPNISEAAYIAQPSAPNFQLDQLDTLDITLFVETMVIAGPVPADQELAYETIVHRRIQRTTEAVAAVIRRSGTLLGTVDPIDGPPRGGVGNPSWLGKAPKGQGARYIWQGSRLQYTLKRHAAIS